MRQTASQSGLRWIIAYKFTLAPITLALAVWLTFSPTGAYEWLIRVSHALADAGAVWSHVARFMTRQLSIHVLSVAALFAWLGGLWTAVEGWLLLRCGIWGERVVTVALALLLPLELFSLIRHPDPAKAILFVINTAIVAYLIYRRVHPKQHPVQR